MHIQDSCAVSYSRSDQQESGVDLLLRQVSGERGDGEHNKTPTSFCGRCVKLPETRCGKLLLGAGIIVAVGLVGTLFSIPVIARSICVQPENTIKLTVDSQDSSRLGKFYSAQVDRISLRENLEDLLNFSPRAWNSPNENYLRAVQNITSKLHGIGLATYQQNYSFSDVGSDVTPSIKGSLSCELELATALTSNSCNLFTLIPGKSSKVVVLGAHLDTVWNSKGANDNGSGVIAVMEIARIFSKNSVQFEHPVLLSFWGGEEIGLLGSRFLHESGEIGAIVSALSNGAVADDVTMQCYINLDGVGSKDPLPYFIPLWLKDITVDHPDSEHTIPPFASYDAIPSPPGTRELANQFLWEFDQAGTCAADVKPRALSDHASFSRNSVPAVHILALADDCYHRPCDNSVDRVDFDKLEEIIKTSIRVITRLAQNKEELQADA